MKGDCERASPSPADKRAPKILTRPRAARSPGPQRRQEQAVPALPAEGSWGDGGTAGSSAGCSLITSRAPCWQTCPLLPSPPQGATATFPPDRRLKSREQGTVLGMVAPHCHLSILRYSLSPPAPLR